MSKPKRQKTLQAHQHILVAVPRTRYEHLRCTLVGCSYGEYWNHATHQYEPYGPAVYGLPQTKANVKKLESASASAVRPHALWETPGQEKPQ